MRDRIRSLIEEAGSVEIRGEADSVVDALAQFKELRPDAILLDLYLKEGNSFGVVTEVKRSAPACSRGPFSSGLLSPVLDRYSAATRLP